MAFNYDKTANTALTLLTRFGKKWDLVRISKAFDPVSQEETDPEVNRQKATLAVVPFNSSDQSRMDDNLREALTLGRLRKMIVAGKGLTAPLPGDIFPTLFGDVYIIRGVTPLNVAGVPIIYTVIAEKGSLTDADKEAITP